MRILSCALDERSNIGSELSIFKCTHSNGSVQLLWCKVQRSTTSCIAGAPCVDGNPRR
ncbi:hypothetical protein HBI56_210440 [Parastagonospora nodorum]|uniref:Uncharacterized protein n=1 Tax=Phaeosphaeria nodorum (strain SN15 / ATCC MYA-4574 / FGSC 10173) TaxID=321614 RepID=A0A7U2I0Z2_PHANO|nr:hypothetical protein HBH56_213860 [Parastagonospora nodorum]QRC97828.1 hypothetical protein JI435_411090 [Parastagonospora nodorum SN15]KAH3923061.1 hypothetical protein HBH54_215530 [Parastagonospora nodorum]KAH3941841.1 hypothetical protein HBH53_196560 [Parastagonospora nodorum]KAH3966819.1 hypothetical protein HBH52_195590 [Parastagonospora nodorum]